MSTIRDRIEAISKAMRSEQAQPADIRSFEVTLASLLWNVNLEVTAAKIAFKQAIHAAEGESAAARKEAAEAGETYARLLEAESTHESCKQMLLTCRNHGRSLSEEMRLSR